MRTALITALLVASMTSGASAQRMTPCGNPGQPACPEIYSQPLPPKLKPFSQQAWLKASNSSPNWSRDGIELPDTTGWPRPKVIALLGTPGMMEQEISPGREDNNRRFDTYRLTASNYESLTIEYDENDVETQSEQNDRSGCKCESCDPSAKSVDMTKVKEFTTSKQFTAREGVTLAQADDVLGRGKLSWGTHQTAGRYWVHYSETWPVAGQAHTFFRLHGYEAMADATDRDIREDHIRDGTYILMQFFPNCLPGG